MERGRRLASSAKGRQLFRSSRDEMNRLATKGRTVLKAGWLTSRPAESNGDSNETWRKLARRIRPPQVYLFLFQEIRGC